MSTIVAQTLSNGTVSTSTANCIQGSAKAWVNFNGTGTVAIRASYNVSSITDNGTGNYTINFTNAFADTSYAAVFGAGAGSANADAVVQEAYGSGNLRSTTQLKIFSVQSTFSFIDTAIISVSCFR